MKIATIKDFKPGTILVDSEGNKFKLISKYDNGIWESKNKVHFESEAKFYKINRTLSWNERIRATAVLKLVRPW